MVFSMVHISFIFVFFFLKKKLHFIHNKPDYNITKNQDVGTSTTNPVKDSAKSEKGKIEITE